MEFNLPQINQTLEELKQRIDLRETQLRQMAKQLTETGDQIQQVLIWLLTFRRLK